MKMITVVNTYTLEMFSQGLELEKFLELQKPQMVAKAMAKCPEAEQVRMTFDIKPISEYFDSNLIANQVYAFQREDGQFVYNGDFTPREKIYEMVLRHSKIVELTCYVEERINPIKSFEIGEYNNDR